MGRARGIYVVDDRELVTEEWYEVTTHWIDQGTHVTAPMDTIYMESLEELSSIIVDIKLGGFIQHMARRIDTPCVVMEFDPAMTKEARDRLAKLQVRLGVQEWFAQTIGVVESMTWRNRKLAPTWAPEVLEAVLLTIDEYQGHAALEATWRLGGLKALRAILNDRVQAAHMQVLRNHP